MSLIGKIIKFYHMEDHYCQGMRKERRELTEHHAKVIDEREKQVRVEEPFYRPRWIDKDEIVE